MELIRVNQYILPGLNYQATGRTIFALNTKATKSIPGHCPLKMKSSNIDNFAWVFVVYFLAKIGQDLVEGFAVE